MPDGPGGDSAALGGPVENDEVLPFPTIMLLSHLHGLTPSARLNGANLDVWDVLGTYQGKKRALPLAFGSLPDPVTGSVPAYQAQVFRSSS